MSIAQPTIAIIGAGMSGLACARDLHAAGVSVQVFEKSYGVGGRMSTRKAEGDRFYDHGAQYFTARDKRFQQQVSDWLANGTVAEWQGHIVVLNNGKSTEKQDANQRFVGVPNMREPSRQLAESVSITHATRIASLAREHERWHLQDDSGIHHGPFDGVVVSAPAPQAAELLSPIPELAEQAQAATMLPSWATMAAFDEPLEAPFDGAFVHDSPLSWIARNNSKPNRPTAPEAWVLHATPEDAAENLERDPTEVAPMMLNAFWQATRLPPREPRQLLAHRWRYALPSAPLEDRCLFDPRLRVGACGDWCGGPRVEGAFLSGTAVAEKLLATLR